MSWSTAASRSAEPAASFWPGRRSKRAISRAAGTKDACLDSRIAVRRAFARHLSLGERVHGRRRGLACGAGDRKDLAAVVASCALHAAAEPRRALPPLRLVRRQVPVAALLSRRLRGLPRLRLARLPPHARHPDGHPLQLDP